MRLELGGFLGGESGVDGELYACVELGDGLRELERDEFMDARISADFVARRRGVVGGVAGKVAEDGAGRGEVAGLPREQHALPGGDELSLGLQAILEALRAGSAGAGGVQDFADFIQQGVELLDGAGRENLFGVTSDHGFEGVDQDGVGFALLGLEGGDEIGPALANLGGRGLARVVAGLAQGVGVVVGFEVGPELGELSLGVAEGAGGVELADGIAGIGGGGGGRGDGRREEFAERGVEGKRGDCGLGSGVLDGAGGERGKSG